jgi:5-methylcytosine-specific restriction protein B
MNFYFGKFSKIHPDQIINHYYAGGKKGNNWYGDIQIGDYVYPIYEGYVSQLWKAVEYKENYSQQKNNEDVLIFEVVNEFDKITISSAFLRCKYFKLDLNLLNKSIKSTKKGFFKISMELEFDENNLPKINQKRKISIVDKKYYKNQTFEDRDICIVIDCENKYSISSIEEYNNNSFREYNPLWDLYEIKNLENERYGLKELLEYSIEDNAPKKEKYLEATIDSLDEDSFFIVSNPVALYDNIIVGRKITKTTKRQEIINNTVIEEEIEEPFLEIESYDYLRKLIEDNPNLIFYGPPGTGKTYTAQRLIENIEYQRTGNFRKFESLVNEERIKFITFHQSYSYEEFIEGIRPTYNEDASNKNSVQYKIQDGIVKKLVNSANLNYLKEENIEITNNSSCYKISLGQRNNDNEIYNDCINNNFIAIGWLNDISLENMNKENIANIYKEDSGEENHSNNISTIDLFVNQLEIGDLVFVYDSPSTIRDIGIIQSNYIFEENAESYQHRRNVKWLKHFDSPFDISEINNGVKLTLKTIYHLSRIQFSDIKNLLSVENDKNNLVIQENKKLKPCYLIIDEINRGNISKIFGELITLIEKDKRDVLPITLPYSQKTFRLPKNLFIIGTMNTADRSIALLDTALRRRFTFVELEPNPEIIRDISSELVEDEINLVNLLTALNEKIVSLYDRDHRIGHSYFLDINSLTQLRNVWDYKIIPLLMDYFYNDLKSVSVIIGSEFIDSKNGEMKKLSNADFKIAIKKIYD